MHSTDPIRIMIRDTDPCSQQHRALTEIAWELNKEFPLEIHSFNLETKRSWPNMTHVKYEGGNNRPSLIDFLGYQLKSWKNLRGKKNIVVQSTGTSSLQSDVIQVQFIHHAWQDTAVKLPPHHVKDPSPIKSSYYSTRNLYEKSLESKLYTPNKRYIAISHSIKKELMEYFSIPADNIEIIYHGVDNHHFESISDNPTAQKKRAAFRLQNNIEESDFILLHVGALNARKGSYNSLETLSYLKKNNFPQVKLLAVGSGRNDHFNKVAAEMDVTDRLIAIPEIEDVRESYWAADCLFYPAYYEPFGLVLLEAMASGLPVVASDRVGASELITSGVNGFLFNPWETTSQIANQLLPLIRDPHLGMSVAKQARQTADLHSWERVGEEYRRFYKSLLVREHQN